MIQKEAWYRESLERDLSHLRKTDPGGYYRALLRSGAPVQEIWRAALAIGELPPISKNDLDDLEEAGEGMPSFTTQEGDIHYVVNEEGDCWVPWEYGEDKKTPTGMYLGSVIEHIEGMKGWRNFLDEGPEMVLDAYEVDKEGNRTNRGHPFVKVSFEPRPTSGGPYDETQQDIYFYIHTSQGNARQIAEWAGIEVTE